MSRGNGVGIGQTGAMSVRRRVACAITLAIPAMTMGPSIPGWTTVVHAEDGVDTNTITDSASTNTVLVVTGLLLAFGVGMAVLTVWYWRSTHPDPESWTTHLCCKSPTAQPWASAMRTRSSCV